MTKEQGDGLEMPDRSSDSKRTMSGEAVLIGIAQVCESLGFIVLTVILARLVTQTVYGQFRELWLVHRSFQDLAAIGLPLTIQYYLPKIAGRIRRRFMVRTLALLFALGSVGSLALYIFSDPVSEFLNDPPLAPLLRIFSFYPLLVLPTQALRAVLIENKQSMRYAAFSIVDQTVMVGSAIGALLYFGDLEAMLLAMVAWGGLKLAVTLVLIFRSIPSGENRGEAVTFGMILAFSLPLAMSMVVDTFYVQVDKLVAVNFLSVERFAEYVNGAFHLPVISTVVSSVSLVLLPEYVRRHDRGDVMGMLSLWHRSVVTTALMFIPLVVMFAVFSRPFVILMFSDTYVGSVAIFRIYVLSLLPRMTWYGFVFIGMGRRHEPVIGQTIVLAVNLMLSVALIRWIGVLGPAIATVVSDVMLMSYYLMRLCVLTPAAWQTVFPWRPLGRVLTVSLLAAIPALPLALMNGIPPMGQFTAGVAVYLTVTMVLFRMAGIFELIDVGLVPSPARKYLSFLRGGSWRS